MGIVPDTELEKQGSTSGEKYCGRTDLDQYVVHVSGNTRKGEFKCKLCGKISTSKQASFNHVENQHFPGRYEYNCGRCNKKFDTYTKLADHRSSRPGVSTLLKNELFIQTDIKVSAGKKLLSDWGAI